MNSQCTAKTLRDTKTKELATELTAALETQTGKRPHLIVNHLNRRKLDPNRDTEEAAFNVSAAVTAYNEYHKFITDARAHITGAGLLLDIHGQSHPEKWIELGYLISKSRLNTDDLKPALSSIRSLYNRHSTSMNFDALLRGTNSFGGLLSSHGYKVVPSPGNMSPGSGNFYSGGYTVKTYGSRYGDSIDAIQIESPYALRTSERATYVAALTAVVKDFLKLYY
ncbi:uncharacterized protein LOC106172454 [Lingula anatina]|uniref:Uncharacterized protein LOC106172454 n=1 Tax=Lingula anatina TaxID=7574 RepID=A0A1S3JFG9_LINAN|nr:uncharacterized protein LOC106172454 [Lingula anatina]|eukprot:XP_013408634.1 uncharacterized protein LOC106172454 [Lingula anatina]